MYYAHFILSKKGPLAKIWLAAHWDKKLTKAQIYETNIESTIETILEPKMKLALRTSGHLLLGVCRIYSRKVKYLLADCNEAFVKIKMAFRPGLIDAPREKQQQACIEAITLQEKLPDIDMNIIISDINMNDIDMTTNLLANQARVEDITLKEDYINTIVTQEDDFGDMDFGMTNFVMNDFEITDERQRDESNLNVMLHDEIPTINSDLAQNDDQSTRVEKMDIDTIEELNEVPALQEQINNLTVPIDIMSDSTAQNVDIGVVPMLFEEQTTVAQQSKIDETSKNINNQEQEEEIPLQVMQTVTNQVAHGEKILRPKRKKKLVVDDVKEINSASMKAQLSDTSDILGSLELAPPTRKLMQLKERGSVDRLFKTLNRTFNDRYLTQYFTVNMISRNESELKIKHKHAELPSLLNQKSNSTKFATSFIESNNYSILSEKQREQNESVAQVGNDILPLVDSIIDNQNDVTKFSVPRVPGDDSLSINNNTLTDVGQSLGGDMSIIDVQEPASILQTTNTSLDESHILARQQRVRKTLEMTPVDDDLDLDQPSQRSRRQSQRKSVATSLQKDDTLIEESQLENDDSSVSLTKRAKTMISVLNRNLSKHPNVGFFEVTKRNGRKQIVQKFYSLLVLKKFDIIDVSQEDTYDDIIISKTDKFDTFSVNC